MLELVQAPNDVLTTPVEPIEDISEAREVAMKLRSGIRIFGDLIGLAANQIGIAKAVTVVLLGDGTADARWVTMVNPRIVVDDGYQRTQIEGCGSLKKGKELYRVTRPWNVQVEYTDECGDPQHLNLQGMDARVVQHEVDHLNGILISQIGEPYEDTD